MRERTLSALLQRSIVSLICNAAVRWLLLLPAVTSLATPFATAQTQTPAQTPLLICKHAGEFNANRRASSTAQPRFGSCDPAPRSGNSIPACRLYSSGDGPSGDISLRRLRKWNRDVFLRQHLRRDPGNREFTVRSLDCRCSPSRRHRRHWTISLSAQILKSESNERHHLRARYISNRPHCFTRPDSDLFANAAVRRHGGANGNRGGGS